MLVRIANWGETLIRLTASEEVWAVCLGFFFWQISVQKFRTSTIISMCLNFSKDEIFQLVVLDFVKSNFNKTNVFSSWALKLYLLCYSSSL